MVTDTRNYKVTVHVIWRGGNWRFVNIVAPAGYGSDGAWRYAIWAAWEMYPAAQLMLPAGMCRTSKPVAAIEYLR